MQKHAFIDGPYRYWLTRTWDRTKPVLAWVMLNPSTADATTDDSTIRRCIPFSEEWGYGGIVVVNLFALRVTDPTYLAKHPDPVGPDNDYYLRSRTKGLRVVAAWGNRGLLYGRGKRVGNLLAGRCLCLGVTSARCPKHPLYLPGITRLVPYN